MTPHPPQAVPVTVPVTVLTGFLGSGKTTVLNRLLDHPSFARTVVIINEFGDIGLDHELVVATTETMILLQSGCMCCTLRGDLLETLIDLAQRSEAGEMAFERVVIETTGLADPAPILHTLMTGIELSGRFAVEGVVATVDAALGAATLQGHEEARRQVALADLVLLTKTDLPQAEESRVRSAIADLNAAAPVRTVLHGDVDPAVLVGLGHFETGMGWRQARDWLAQDRVPGPRSTGTDAPTHLERIRSVAWTIDQPVNGTVFDIWMDLLMARRGEDLLRFKGLIHLADMPYPFAVHGVQHIFHPPVPLQDWRGDDRRTKLVLIVRDFTDPELRELFSALSSVRTTAHALPLGYLSEQVAQ
ncbi:GTP-binding protein [Paracoccus sp. S3-43]|uniref:CobW family GTP-binding protein n=1 Tax=Paracoccus sp. S3-43 TaxID=3030011 RepID=UPI0023B19FB3|nr:GTP-binding protein [Paracoccus sp. S3-43]WEF24865.1 GTP-binding protein [Paracoccus sp. S3-43]